MDSLLAFIERMTHGRERPQLELGLAEALVNFLHVGGVRLFKCQQALEETLVWLAVEVSSAGKLINDTGLSIPESAQSVDELPLIKTFIQTGLPDFTDERILLPVVMDNGRWFGYIEVLDAGNELGLSVEQLLTAGRLVAIFKNMMSLLEYSEIDTLTGLLNRKTFDEYLIRILASIEPGDSPLPNRRAPRRRPQAEQNRHWLGVIDIDHFKRINDNFGHSIGDEVLLLLAGMMKMVFRTNDKLFRFGGEEFVVLLKPAEARDAHAAFERFRLAIEAREFPLVGRVTVSIGYAQIALRDQRTTIFDRADNALYWAKEHGRNQTISYESLIAGGHIVEKQETSDIEYF